MKSGAILRLYAILCAILVSSAMIGCGGGDSPDNADNTTNGTSGESMATEMPKTYTGAQVDSSVTPEMGGIGFEEVAEGEGWQTNTIDEEQYYKYYASKDAKKGGELIFPQQDYPAVIRPYGKDANTVTISLIESLVYEPMTGIDPITLELLPILATHWKVGEDGQTYFFRINPHARFSDGYPVTSDDVLATHKLVTDKTIIDPYYNFQFGEQFDPPQKISPYIFSVKSKEKNWKNMRIFGGLSILPAHVIGDMPGSEFLEKFKYNLPPGSGPYTVLEKDINPQTTLTLTRLTDWWQKDDPLSQGQYNFDKITFKTINLIRLHRLQSFLLETLDVYLVKTCTVVEREI